MKDTKIRRVRGKAQTVMRLVSMETPNGTFLRYVFLSTDEFNNVTGYELLPLVYNDPAEAANIAYQMAEASSQPVVEIGRKFVRVH